MVSSPRVYTIESTLFRDSSVSSAIVGRRRAQSLTFFSSLQLTLKDIGIYQDPLNEEPEKVERKRKRGAKKRAQMRVLALVCTRAVQKYLWR